MDFVSHRIQVKHRSVGESIALVGGLWVMTKGCRMDDDDDLPDWACNDELGFVFDCAEVYADGCRLR